jgi:putative transposase
VAAHQLLAGSHAEETSHELLNETLFLDLDHARQLIGTWAAEYNTAGPHSSLGYKTPTAYAQQLTASTDAKPVEALIAAE